MVRFEVAFIGGRGVGGKYSGIETWYENIAPRLAGRGHAVTIYCRSYFTPPAYSIPGVRLVRLPSFRSKHFDTPFHSLWSTLHAMRHRHDIVHYHAAGSLLAWAPRWRGSFTVATVHALDWQRAKWGRIASRVMKLAEWASVRAPDATTAVSASVAAYLRETYGATVHLIPNGVTVESVPPPEGLERMGLEPRRYLLFAGRLSPEKGCHTLLKAHRESGTDLRLVFAGGAIEKSYERRLRKEASDKTLFLGYVDSATLARLYSYAFLFVLPSHLEGLSMSLLEAMSYGCPVAVSDIPENTEIVDGAGLVFPPGDWRRLRDLLREAAQDPQRLRSMGEAARGKVRATYDWDRVADRLEGLYRDLLAERGGVRRLGSSGSPPVNG